MSLFRRRRPRRERAPRAHEPIGQLVDEARAENPDETTRREAYELELMNEERSQEGAQAEVDEPGDGR